MFIRAVLVMMMTAAAAQPAHAQTKPLWHEDKVRNFLPHMTCPEVRDLLTRTDMVLIPVPSIEQHGLQTPMGTDFYAGVEEAKETGKHTSAGEMSTAGVWSQRNPREATAELGRRAVESSVDAAVRFIERWKALRPR